MSGKDIKNDAYRQYLEQRHSKFSVNPSVVESAIKKATGKVIEGKRRIVAGEVNEVYDVKTEDGNLIVRISREEENRFFPEKWAIEKSGEAGVPVPEVLLIDEAEDNDKKMWVVVETKLHGESLDRIADLSEVGMKQITEQAGEILAKIHSVTTKGFGRVNKDGVGDCDSWKSYMLRSLRPQQVKGTLESAKRAGIATTQIDQALRIIGDNSKLYEGVSPHLLHGDFGPKHILVGEGLITGIIDFENCKSGDPTFDFSWWSYFGKNRPSLDWLKSGYERIAKLPPDFERRVLVGKLRLGMDMIWYYDNEENDSGIRLAKKNLEEDLSYFFGGILTSEVG